MIPCGGGVKSAVRDRMSCAWSKWRELASLLVNHTIPLEERAKVYCACVRLALLYAVETWTLTLKKIRLRLFDHVKRRDENSILGRVMELEVCGK